MSVKFRQEQTAESAIKAIEKLEFKIKNQLSGSSFTFFNQQASSVKKEIVENTPPNLNSPGKSRSSS